MRGAVRDSQGKPVAGATVQLRASGAKQAETIHTDSSGAYSFATLPGGVYDLRATMAGYGDLEIAAIFVAPKAQKMVDVTLPAAKFPAFFDQPEFTVSGVTDTTELGGHGSEVMVHTRETIAEETASLGKASSGVESTPTSEAEKSLREHVAREPESFEFNHQLGKLLVESHRGREAIRYLDRAAEIKPGDYENAYDLACANLQAGSAALARERVQTLLAHYDNGELHHLLADAEKKLGNPLDAVREYQRAAELDHRENYFFDWGSELLLHHAAQPAVDVFSAGSGLYPRSVRMRVGLAAAWYAQGSYDRAVQDICEASDLSPDDPIPYLFMGKMQAVEISPSGRVVEKLRRFASLEPDNAQANYYLAASLWKLRSGSDDIATAAQVESLLKRALRLDPKLAAAHLQLGILHSEQKNFPEAVADFQNAIDAHPQTPLEEAHYRLAQAYRQMGHHAEADAELHIYRNLAKESAERAERERHDIPQFVYQLRGQPQ